MLLLDEEFERAHTEFDRALALNKELFASDNRRIAELEFRIGRVHTYTGKYMLAVPHLESALSILEANLGRLTKACLCPPALRDSFAARLPKDSDATSAAASKDSKSAEGDDAEELRKLCDEIRSQIEDARASHVARERAEQLLRPRSIEESKGTAAAIATSIQENMPEVFNQITKLVRKRKITASGDDGVLSPSNGPKAAKAE